MTQYSLNEKCIVGIPTCGYGFSSSRMAFLARPADGEFQLEEDILSQILKDRNYELYAALQRIDPGNFAFCTKICSKIITSHFCLVLLNNSKHQEHKDVMIANPNVHFEYGMMLSFHKHVIPMQRDTESLPFNIYPIDTIKYKPENFKTKAESAIDDAIIRFKTKEPAGRPIGPSSDVLKFFSFRGLRYTDVNLTTESRALFSFGQMYGFNLFDGQAGIIFFGFFHEEDPREIVVRIKFLINNIDLAYHQIEQTQDENTREKARRILDQISIESLIPKKSNKDTMMNTINTFQPGIRSIPVKLYHLSEIETFVKVEYEKIII